MKIRFSLVIGTDIFKCTLCRKKPDRYD